MSQYETIELPAYFELPSNFYLIFNDIETEILSLAYKITLDEAQKTTYSPFIAELELRIFAQIEDALKYTARQSDPTSDLKYDEIIPKLDYLKKNELYASWNAYNFTKKIYNDVFKKNEQRIDKVVNGIPKYHGNRKNYKFNNAYQNLRHDFSASISYFGTLEYLFESFAALSIILNKDQSQIFSQIYDYDELTGTVLFSKADPAPNRTGAWAFVKEV